MNTFISNIANDLIERFGTNLAHIAVVFPNKRAALFLNQELAKLADGPIWSPAYITISELFRQQSNLTVADPIKSLCDLYKSYTSITGRNEDLDEFYGWVNNFLVYRKFCLWFCHNEIIITQFL